MIKYRTQFIGTRFAGIQPVTVIRETETMVILPAPGGRELKAAKVSPGRSYHDTWDQAKAFLIEQSNKEIDRLNALIAGENEKLRQVKECQK